MKKRMKQILIMLYAALAVVSIFNFHTASAAEAPDNYINIVYDDSGSMYTDDGAYFDKWCNANYAMSVFAAMMDSGDTMNIYPMGMQGACAATIDGSDTPASRVRSINTIELAGSNTYFSAVEGAYADLRNAPSSMNRWLVVLTDGKFTGKSASSVASALESYADQGIRVIYLAIGQDIDTIDDNRGGGFYAYYAKDSDAILPQVTVVANQIFENYEFDDRFFRTQSGSITLNFEVPMEQVTLFAQGANIQIGSLVSSSQTIACQQTVSVKASDDNIPVKYTGDARIQLDSILASNSGLQGCIATFSTAGQLIPAGEYTVQISDTSNVEVYARPVVDIGARFYSGTEAVAGNTDLQEGTYRYEIVFIDPLTGEVVDSELLSDTRDTIEAEITVNGESSTGGAEGEIHVTEGTLEISASAVLPSGKTIRTEQDLVFSVTPKQPPAASVVLYGEDGSPVAADAGLVSGEYRYEVVFTDPLTGGEADPALVGEATVDVEAEMNGQTQVLSASGGTLQVEPGTLTLRATTALPNGQQKENASTLDVVRKLDPIALSISGDTTMDLKELEDNSLLVTAAMYGQPLSEEVWEKTTVSAQSSGDVDWVVEKGDTVSTWRLSPRYPDGNILKTTTGESDVTVTASLAHDRQTVTGETTEQVNIKDMSFLQRLGEWLKRNWWWIVSLLLIAFLLWAYLSKKRFKPISFEQNGIIPMGFVPRNIEFDKVKSTIFLPFVPERGSFYGRVDVNMKTHTFSFDVAADDDQMKVISVPSFKDGDQVILGATHFLYRSVNRELRVVPDITQNDVYFGYHNEIRLSTPEGTVRWNNHAD